MHTAVLRRPPPSSEPQLPQAQELATIALLLDVDGTLLDTAITPDSVVVPRSLGTSLQELYAKSGGALALVSGRLIRDLDALFAPLRLPAIGGHGAEIRVSGDHITQTRHDATLVHRFRGTDHLCRIHVSCH